ncbi:MAG TPA: phosphohydrolase, partial [Mucilaginibacter sp.]|nr:phosphohydrolase [Mucilaginibacter sp.]
RLNVEFGGGLLMAIEVFNGTYPKRFLHELVSGQLDMDRMDYLNRDSFFTGVSEGVISFDRIIKMLDVVDDHIAVEEKGIYSIEKFLIARRLMYWQVYLHKTVVSAEQLLAKILKRARELALAGNSLFATPDLNHFLVNKVSKADFMKNERHIDAFAGLDDTDIMSAIKVWADDEDFVLSQLCGMMMRRNLYHVDITSEPPDQHLLRKLIDKASAKYPIMKDEAGYFVFTDTITNNAYKPGDGSIRILMKDGTLHDIASASDNSNLEALAKTVKKYVFCYTKDLI